MSRGEEDTKVYRRPKPDEMMRAGKSSLVIDSRIVPCALVSTGLFCISAL
jgi:hypothetical protein